MTSVRVVLAPMALVIAMSVAGCSSDEDAAARLAPVDVTEAPAELAAAPFDPNSDARWAIQSPEGAIEVTGIDGATTFTVSDATAGADRNNPDWSPDGARLAFTVSGGRDDLWVVDVDGSNARLVADCTTPCVYYDDPAWSPDGRSIAVCKMVETDAGAIGSLVVVDAESGDESTVVDYPLPEYCAGPRWSPDGDAIVLEVVEREGNLVSSDVVGVTLTVIDVATTDQRALTDPARFAASADWNGDLIVFSAVSDDDLVDLFTVHPDGSDLHRLTALAAEGADAEQPSFVPDGTAVVFVDGVNGRLLRVDLESGAVTAAFPGDLFGFHPRPRPNG